jgi:hypothetical protein
MGSGENSIKFIIPSLLIPTPPNEVDKRLVSIVNNLVANVIE